ncbi:MAG: hypothetical protein JWP12_2788 [Bacteroidetes bacterium]|nr:hypothetical protein [Bacteroidota bacterium]
MKQYEHQKNDRWAAVKSRRDLVMRMQQAKEQIDQEEEHESNQGVPVSGEYDELEGYNTANKETGDPGAGYYRAVIQGKLDELCDYDSKKGERQEKALEQEVANRKQQQKEEDLPHKLKRQEKKALRKRAKAEKEIGKDPKDKKAKAEFNKQNDAIKKIMGVTEADEKKAKESGQTIFNIKENYTDDPPAKKAETFDPKKTAEELIAELTEHPFGEGLPAYEIKMLLSYGVYDSMSESSKIALARFLKLYVSDASKQHQVFVDQPDPFDPAVLIKLFTPGTLEVDSKMKKENSYENRWVANHKDETDLSKHQQKKLKRLEGKGHKGDVINPDDYKETLKFENKFIDVLGNLQKEAAKQKGQDITPVTQAADPNTSQKTAASVNAEGTSDLAAYSDLYHISVNYVSGIDTGDAGQDKLVLFNTKYANDNELLATFFPDLKAKIANGQAITVDDVKNRDMFPWLPTDLKNDKGWVKVNVSQETLEAETKPAQSLLINKYTKILPHTFGAQTALTNTLQTGVFSFVEKNKWPLLTAGAVTAGTGLFFIGKDIFVPDLKSGNWEKDLASITRFIPKQTFKIGFGQTYSQGLTNFAPWKGSFAFDPSKTDPAPSGDLKSFTGTDFIKKVDPLDLRAKHISPLALDATFQLGQESKRLGDPWLNNNFEAYAKARYYYETNSTDINLFQMAEWAKLHFDAPKALDMIKTGTTTDITKNFATNPAAKLDFQTGGLYTFKTGAIKFTTGVDYLSMNNLDPSDKLYRAFLFKTAYEQTIKLDLGKKMPPADLKVSGNVSSGVSDIDNNFMAKKDITQYGANLTLDFKKQNGTTKQATSIGLGYSGAAVTDPNKSQGQTTTTDALNASLKFNAANTKWFQFDVGLDLTKSLQNKSSSGSLFVVIRPK